MSRRVKRKPPPWASPRSGPTTAPARLTSPLCPASWRRRRSARGRRVEKEDGQHPATDSATTRWTGFPLLLCTAAARLLRGAYYSSVGDLPAATSDCANRVAGASASFPSGASSAPAAAPPLAATASSAAACVGP